MYSQQEEERYILEAFAGRAKGTFLDVGAWDGKAFSNTLRLAELGWSGVLVEPSPGPFRQLLQLHGKNPAMSLVNAAVVPAGGAAGGAPMRFYLSDDAVSTSVEQFRDIWAPTIAYLPAYVMPIEAPSLVAFCAAQLGASAESPVDFVNVDTEGTSYEVAEALFRAFAARGVRPRVWCVEYATRYRLYEKELVSLFDGYKIVYRSGENLIFA